MFLLNNKSRVLKYKNDVLTVNPQMIEMVVSMLVVRLMK